MSLLGVAVATALEHSYGDGWESAAKKVLGAALLVCGLAFLVKALLQPRLVAGGPFRLSTTDRMRAFTIGVIGGFVVGLTSVGSGTFFGLTMMIFFPLSMAQIVGTDRVLRVALATTLFLSGVKLINFRGSDDVVIAGAGVALLAGTVAVVRALRRRAAARVLVDPVEEAAGS